MEIQIFGAAKEVTGSCYSLSSKDEKILIDCGLFQGSKENAKKNYEDFPFNPSKYSALLLTHAHLDHCGRIPKLVKYGFRGKIYATDATKELAFVIMMDAAKIAAEDTEHENKGRAEQGLPPRKPIYNTMDVESTMKLFTIVSYNKEVKITKNISSEFFDAGHILGAASILVKVKDGKKTTSLAFSGDLGQENSVLVKNTNPIKKADYVFVESTYGDRLHPPREKRNLELVRIIKESYKRGGKLMIPSFAVERAQEMLYLIGGFMEQGLIPKMKVYLDSPMAIKATKIFAEHIDYYNDNVKKNSKLKSPFDFSELVYAETVEQSKEINFIKEPCIVIAGNGMCTAGRIKHHIKNGINNPQNTLLFIGYQVKGTLGYWIKKGEKIIRLLGTQVKVKAKIEAIEGFSAHADSKELMGWMKSFSPKPKKVFLTHGDEEQSKIFLKKLDNENFSSSIPAFGEKIIL